MSKPQLFGDQNILERQIIETMVAGLQQWRPDLTYPASHSDLMACARGIMQMFDLERLPLPRKLRYTCVTCEGTGHMSQVVDGLVHRNFCKECEGRGYCEAS